MNQHGEEILNYVLKSIQDIRNNSKYSDIKQSHFFEITIDQILKSSIEKSYLTIENIDRLKFIIQEIYPSFFQKENTYFDNFLDQELLTKTEIGIALFFSFIIIF